MKLVYYKCDIFPISDMIIWISNIILYVDQKKRVINLKDVKRRTITGINVYAFFIPLRLDWICSLGARCRLWTNLNEWGGSERSPNRGRCPTVRRSLPICTWIYQLYSNVSCHPPHRYFNLVYVIQIKSIPLRKSKVI